MAKVLICDDSVFMRRRIRDILTFAGHSIIGEVDNSDDAIRFYKEHKPDIVTMDMIMKTSGVEAVKQIMKFDSKARIAVVSVLDTDSSDVVNAIRSGARAIVSKPIKEDVLISEIERLLEEK